MYVSDKYGENRSEAVRLDNRAIIDGSFATFLKQPLRTTSGMELLRFLGEETLERVNYDERFAALFPLV